VALLVEEAGVASKLSSQLELLTLTSCTAAAKMATSPKSAQSHARNVKVEQVEHASTVDKKGRYPI